MKFSSSAVGTQKSAPAAFARRSHSGRFSFDSPTSVSMTTSSSAFPSSRSTCSISWRSTNQKLSMRSNRNVMPMTGFCSSSQKQAPSIFKPARGSTKTRRTPASARTCGTWRTSSGDNTRAFNFSIPTASFAFE